MSAYVVPAAHIAALVRAANRGPVSGRAVSPDSVWHRPTWFASDPRSIDFSAATADSYFARMAEIRREADHESIGRVADMLTAACVASVSYRYPDDKPDELSGPIPPYWLDPIDWRPLVNAAPDLAPVAVLKALDGYEYQSCEHPDWRESEAHSFCDALRSAVIGRLPGYQDAAWEIDTETAESVVAGR